MAFTPINSSDAITDNPDGTNIISQEDLVAPSHLAPTTIASTYLGRGEPAKKPAAKSKKRASTAVSQPKTKRRQTSSGFNVSKASVMEELDVTQHDTFTTAPLESSSSKPDHSIASLPTPATSVSTTSDELVSALVKPISVYSSKTTMDALGRPLASTSVEYAKARDGQGFTLYQGSSSAASYSSSIAPTISLMGTDLDATIARGQRAAQGSGESASNHRRSARLKKTAKVLDEATPITLSDELSLGIDDDEEFFSDIEVIDLVESNETEPEFRPNTPPKRGHKLNTRDVDELEDYGGALLSDADRQALIKISSGAESIPKPIVRKPFPPSILDRSPIFGASRAVVLRTCFRIGEAMMAGVHGVRNGHDVVIELYARVTACWREPAPGRKQHFAFKDIYHDNPPFLEGTFELWQQAQLWDLDSKVFLGASKGNGIMCRAIARMKRDGQKWRLDVLSVWEASWEDVNYAAGICIDARGA